MCRVHDADRHDGRVPVHFHTRLAGHLEHAVRQSSRTNVFEKMLLPRYPAFGNDHPLISHKTADPVGIVGDQSLCPFFAQRQKFADRGVFAVAGWMIHIQFFQPQGAGGAGTSFARSNLAVKRRSPASRRRLYEKWEPATNSIHHTLAAAEGAFPAGAGTTFAVSSSAGKNCRVAMPGLVVQPPYIVTASGLPSAWR